MFTLRKYQKETVEKGISYFENKKHNDGALAVLPTGSGKSLVIANIAKELKGNTIVFQPSKEILEQNYNKILSYGVKDVAVYSASLNSKNISKITFATIGSVNNKHDLFNDFQNVIVDECHLVNAKGGMYQKFLYENNKKVLGLTATPYRLSSDRFGGSILKFLTRTRPRIFHELISFVQIDELSREGFLSKLEYVPIKAIEIDQLKINSTGADFTDESLRNHLRKINFSDKLIDVIRLLNNKKQKHILVFTKFVDDAKSLIEVLKDEIKCAYVSAETPKKERELILNDFKSGKTKVVANVGILTTGFDFPELDTIVLSRPTMSLGLYYQMVGRGLRPHTNKQKCIVVDMCETYQRFGKIEDLKINKERNNLWFVESNGKKLTNVYFGDLHK